nr:MAG TPA: hypothetical protein [Caudoviricetes sp.]
MVIWYSADNPYVTPKKEPVVFLLSGQAGRSRGLPRA